MTKNGYNGLCKELVEVIASRQEARRGQDYERNKRGIIKSFKEALRELKGYSNMRVSIDFLIDLAYGAVELTKKQIYDKIRWLVKEAEINLEERIYSCGKWHKYGDGTLSRVRSQAYLKFLAV